ncbi:hypothetical protein KTQ42_20895 [Noviherbaspirillum sp. L7-7A]|uniref:hypothetical protein n=1 Tax=Noviherbaspirillum sp. L7-7A TaxID=2850560 RepID=UPI001C2B99AB|nr:hypothetical protein [Noviherbaspirillum sp. L7-7A]MBV0881744.1 hypothetical protein [Noviherbaspirillum sp. L7-7A]
MTKSGTFGDDADAMASQHGEFLAGVLAMARISRLTVALESGTDAGLELLEAARLTGHAETCLLFEDWEDEPLAALLAAAAQAAVDDVPVSLPDAGNEALALQQLFHQAQARRRRSFLLILNRMERLLARPTHDPQYQAFEQALVALADDRELDLHLLLVMDESAEFLLTRLEHRMPGIGDGCLRIPAPSHPVPGAEAGRMRRHELPAQGAAATASTVSASRDRSFGMLLERLTAKLPPEQAGDGTEPMRQHRPDPTHGDVHGIDPHVAFADTVTPQPAADDAIADPPPPVHAALPAVAEIPQAPHPAWQEAPVPQRGASQQEESTQDKGAMQATSGHTPAASAMSGHDMLDMPDMRSTVPPRRRAWPLALGLLLVTGASMLAWHGLPASDSRSTGPTPAATQAAAPSSTLQAQPAPAADEKLAVARQPDLPATSTASKPPDPVPPSATPSASDKPASAAASGNTASASTPAAASASTPAVVYVHVRDARERDKVQAQRRALGAQGIRLMEVKVTSKGPSVADLRYFHDEDRNEALAVQKALLAAGVPVGRLSRMNGFEGSTRRRQYEAWLAGPTQPAATRR